MTTPSGRQRRERTERGTVLIEFSFVFALFAFICYALVAFGMAINLKQNLTHAASEGARSAIGVGAGCDPSTAPCQAQITPIVVSRVNQAVSGQSSDVRNTVAGSLAAPGAVTFSDCNGGPSVSSKPVCVQVAIDYPYSAHPIVPSAPGLGVVMPSVLKATAVVQISNGD